MSHYSGNSHHIRGELHLIQKNYTNSALSYTLFQITSPVTRLATPGKSLFTQHIRNSHLQVFELNIFILKLHHINLYNHIIILPIHYPFILNLSFQCTSNPTYMTYVPNLT